MSKSLEKRTELLEIARKRMLHYGIQKTSVHEIAKDAGIAVGTLYLYFKNKEDIVLALADEYRCRQQELAEEILQARLPADEKIQRFMIQRFRFVQEFREGSPHGKEFVKTLLQLQPERMQEWKINIKSQLTRCLEEGKQQGVFHFEQAAEEAKIFYLSTQVFYPLPYLDLPQWPLESDLRQVMTWFFKQWKERP